MIIPEISYDLVKKASQREFNPHAKKWLLRLFVPGYLYYELFQYLAPTARSIYRYFYDQGRLTNDDTVNINAIIAAGRKENAEEIDIIVNKEQFAGLKTSLKAPAYADVAFPDISLQFGAGGKGDYRIKVKYRDEKNRVIQKSSDGGRRPL